MTQERNPNQVVALNLWNERRARGWNQEEVSSRLAEHGVTWEKATYYAAEASRSEKPARRFSADELLAFAMTFRRPVTWFLTPPEGVTMTLNEEPLYLRDLLEMGLQRDLPDLTPLAERLREVATAIETFEKVRQPEPGAAQITEAIEAMGDYQPPTLPEHEREFGERLKLRETAETLREVFDRAERQDLAERLLTSFGGSSAVDRLTFIAALGEALHLGEPTEQANEEEKGTA